MSIGFAGYGPPMISGPSHDFDPDYQPTLYTISGVTKDSGGAVLAFCNVRIFETVSGILRTEVVSDANGRYVAGVPGAQGLTFFGVMYKAGAPDIAGTTVNTLVAVPS